MAFQGLNAANKERRAGQPPVLATPDLDVNFTPQWLLPSKSPSSVLPDPAKGLVNPPWEPVGNKDVRWRADDDPKSDRWGTSNEKDSFVSHARDKVGEPLFRGGKWKDDERDSAAKREGPRWGPPQDETSRWNGGAYNRAQAEPALRNERWNDASRGRGRPLDEKWTRDRDNLGWLPGMGDEPSNRDKRWNEAGFEQFDVPQQEKWRAPGSSRDPAGLGRGRGVGLGRGKPVFKGGDAPDRWGSPVNARNVAAPASVVPGSKYTRISMLELYNTVALKHGQPLPLPESADIKLPGLLSDELPELDNGLDTIKKKERGSSAEEVPTETPQIPAQAYQPPFKRAPSQPVPAGDRTGSTKRELDATVAHLGGRPGDDVGLSLGLGKLGASKEVAPAAPVVSAHAFAADQWIYKDPQGSIQGPFTKVDILDWFEAGFFPPELPIKSARDPADSPFVNLSSMLKMWAHIGANRAPPGFVQGGPAPQGHHAESLGLDTAGSMTADPVAIRHTSQILPETLLGPAIVTQPGLTGQGMQAADPVAIPISNNQQPAMPDSALLNQLNGNNATDQPGMLGVQGATTMHSPFQNEATGTPPDSAFLVGSYDSNTWHVPPVVPQQQHAAPPTAMLPGGMLPGSLLSQQHSQPVGHTPDLVGQQASLLQQQHSAQANMGQNQLVQAHQAASVLHTSQPAAAMAGLPSQPMAAGLAYSQFSLHNAWSHSVTQPVPHTPVTPAQQMQQQFSNALQDPGAQHQLLGNNSLHAPGLSMPIDPAAPPPPANLPSTVNPVQDLRPPAELGQMWTSLPVGPQGAPPTSAAALPLSYQPLAPPPTAAIQQVTPVQETAPVPPQPAPATEGPSPAPAQPALAAKGKAAMADAAAASAVPAAASAIQATSDATPFQEVSKRKKKQGKAAKAEAVVAAAAASAAPAPAELPQAAKVPEPVAAPDLPRPETKPAPWAAAATRAPAQKSLLEIQQEEQARLAAAAAAAATAGPVEMPSAAAAPPPAAPGWAKVASAATAPAAAPSAVAPVTAAPTLTTRPSLREILEEEESRKAVVPPAPAEPPVGTGPGPRGSTFGEILASRLDSGNSNGNKAAAPWASMSRPDVPNLRDVMFEECAADLEGGYVDEDLSDLLPHLQQLQQRGPPSAPAPLPIGPTTPAAPIPPPAYGVWGARPAAPRAAAQTPSPVGSQAAAPAARTPAAPGMVPNGPRHAAPAPAAAHEDDEELFWDYGQKQQTTAPAPSKAAAVAAKPVVVAAAKPAAQTVAKAAPMAAATSKTMPLSSAVAPKVVAMAALRPTQAQGSTATRTQGTNGSKAPQPEGSTFEAELPEVPLVINSLDVSQEFQDWCRKKMLEFNGNDDLTLVEFLWSLPSGGEVAEYCQAYLGNGPAVSSFVAEFIRRKAAEQSRQKSKNKKKVGPAATAAQPSKAGQPKPSTAGSSSGDDGWQATAKAKGKKTKGKKLDPKMLGFTSHYAVLATDD